MKRSKYYVLTMMILLIGLLCSKPVFADEQQPIIVSTEDNITAKAGENVSVPIYLSNNTGLAGYVLEFHYDETKLTPVEIIRGEIFQNGNFENNLESSTGNLKVVWNNSESVTDNGEIFSILFKVNEEVNESCPISISNSSSFTVDETDDWNLLPVTLDCHDVTLAVEHEHTHSFSDWTIVKEATCIEEGQQTRTCAECGETESEAIPIDPAAHKPAEAVRENVVEATASADGSYDEVIYCTLCGAELSRNTVTVSKLADTSSLSAAIDDVLADLTDTSVSENGRDVDEDSLWVSQENADSLVDAMKKALVASADAAASQEEIDAATAALQTAKAAFDENKHSGMKAAVVNLEKLLMEAEDVLENTWISETGEELYTTQRWVSEDIKQSFESSVAEARNIYDDATAGRTDLENASDMLQEARNTFDSACQFGTKITEKEELKIALDEAVSRIEKVEISVDGTDVDSMKTWVTEETANAFSEAIEAAQAVYDLDEVTDEDVALAIGNLKTAQETFVAAVQPGTKTHEDIDRSELSEKISEAVASMVDIVISEDGSDVDPEDLWVTQSDMDTLMNAVTAAMNVLSSVDADQETINETAETLNDAKSAFEAAKQDGSRKEAEPEKRIQKVTVEASEFAYTGSVITPKLTVTDGTNTLTDADYTAEFIGNINIGTATVIVNGSGDYTGTATAKFNIVPASISTAAITGISNKTYTGSAIKPAPVVKIGETTLKANTDYTVAYSNNTKVGTATVTITGQGNYTGALKKTFKITTASIAKATVTGISTKTYTGSAFKPAPTVKLGKVTLKSGTDYTVAYSNNVNVGQATVKITGKGNYTGTVSKTFNINPKGTALSTLTAASKAFTVKWTAQTTKMSKSQITGYQIQYSTSSTFASGNKTVTVKGAKSATKKISSLIAKKRYYVRIRTYMTVSGKNYYSSWSKVKNVTTK